MLKKLNIIRGFVLLCGLLILGGCSAKNVKLDTPEHTAMLGEDLVAIGAIEPAATADEGEPLFLSLEVAISRGVLHNWDARVAAMEVLAEDSDISVEQLKALPSLEASARYAGRSNKGASSSESVLSGTQSLEPSQSTEANRRAAELSLNWNVIDAALALSNGRTAKEETQISKLRYHKVLQNIQRDVYLAYMRALAYQQSKAAAQVLTADLQDQKNKIRTARRQKLIGAEEAAERLAALAGKEQSLLAGLDELAAAEIELKSLISVPLAQDIALDKTAADRIRYVPQYQDFLAQDIAALEWEAIQNRPEMREEVLKKNIAWRNTRQEIIKTLPGAELLAAGNYDSNRFLQSQNWANWSAQLLQSITSLLTAPVRYRDAKNDELLADARRRALMLALMAQTRIAQQRMAYAAMMHRTARAQDEAAAAKEKAAISKKATGFASGEEVLNARLQRLIAEMEAKQARIAMQDAYVAMLNTLGRDVLPSVDLSRIRAEGSG